MSKIELAQAAYGKTDIRLLRLWRGEVSTLIETIVEIRLEGDFAESYTAGDNRRVLPTDTMKNTVYALAREREFKTIEEFGLILGSYLIETQPQVTRATTFLEERPWRRLGDDPHAFCGAGEERYTAKVGVSRADETVESGVKNLLIMKTARSGFEDFPRDRFTTLKETPDRIFATRLEATWRYRVAHEFHSNREAVLRSLLTVFAAHDSRSVQHTLNDMAMATLEACPDLADLHLVMPNKHYLPANLEPFGLDNVLQVFIPTDEPAGRIEARYRRS